MTADAVGGVWTYAVELVRALEARGVDVTVATMGPRPRPEQRAELPGRLVESEFALEWMPDPWEDVDRAGDWLLGLEQEHAPDVVHLNGYVHAALPWSAPVLVVGHSCVLSWWEAVHRGPPPREWEEYRRRVRGGLGAAAVVVAPTTWMLRELVRLYAFAGERRVIANGRRGPDGDPVEKRAYVAAAGRFWDEAKNAAALRRVAPRLPWPLRVAGDDRRAPAAAVRDLLAAAAIFAAPARYEPFGLTALEAGLAGCALVLGDIRSQREVWADSALYVHPEDDDHLDRTLRRLIGDVPLRQLMARRALSRARKYSPEHMADGYADVYRTIARERVAA